MVGLKKASNHFCRSSGHWQTYWLRLSESLKNPGKPVRCFVLPDDDECAVALEYPMTSLVAGDDDSQGSGPVFIVGAAVCLCVCCCLVELMNVRKAVDARSLEECQAYALVE
ncbi:unnamed protein product [Effrenium voratum]|nr:unnamed protein product [Effrenium voratum]